MTEFIDGFSVNYIFNRYAPRRPQLGRAHAAVVDKIALHTTEGDTILGAVNTYRAKAGKWSGGIHPHMTASAFSRSGQSHVPLSKAAYSLKSHDTDGIIQVELVGHADQSHNWPDEELDWIGANVIAPIIRAHPTIPLVAPAPFLGADSGTLARPWPYGKARISPSNWAGVKGIVGHQHLPYDDHWDPGKINIGRIIDAAWAALTTGDGYVFDLIRDSEKKKTYAVFMKNGTTHVRPYTSDRPNGPRPLPGCSYVIEEQADERNLVIV